MTARTDLAAALSGVNGVNVTDYYRQSLKTGDGFIRLAQRTRDKSGFGWIDTYEAWLAVPQNEADAEKWIEGNLPALCDAANTVAWVTQATPSELALASNVVVSGLIITCAVGV